MSMEERIVALEQGLAAVQQELLLQRTDTSSAQLMSLLSRVILMQERNYRELSENITILVGLVVNRGQDIKDIKDIKEDLDNIKEGITNIKIHLARRDEQLVR